jgi:N-methylhydantoinase A
MRLGVDIGGTFTDFVLERDGRIHFYKTPTMPGDLVSGVIAGLRTAAEDQSLSLSDLLGAIDRLVHGTTVATNALLTGQTARTAFLTTEGHPDILVLREAGRMGLPLFDHAIAYPAPYVPRSLTFEVPERTDAEGRVVRRLDESAVMEILERLRHARVDAIAVCLLWSIVNPLHERRLGELIARGLPGMPVSLSHEVNPCLREYRRASATCIDASLKPVAASYLGQLEGVLRDAGFGGRLLIGTSTGSVADAAEVAGAPVHLLRSGPALGPVAASAFVKNELAAPLAVVIDAGGTTFDVSLLRDGSPCWTRETWIGRPYLGHMTGFPSVDVRSIGAGGGSIAHVDAGGLLQVGPQSAGAKPGPACYAAGGTRATVTDAALVLGYIDPSFSMGRTAHLDENEARGAVLRDVGMPLGLDVADAAEAVLRVFVEDAASAIEDMTVLQGTDTSGSLLVATGGAAGLASVALARRLGCDRILVPPTAAVNCAAGGLLAEPHRDFTQTRMLRSAEFDLDSAMGVLKALETQCHAFLGTLNTPTGTGTITFSVEAKYEDQNWEIVIPVPPLDGPGADFLPVLVNAFHREHQRLYHHKDPDAEILFHTWRARATMPLSGPVPLPIDETSVGAPLGRRMVRLPGEPFRDTRIVTPGQLAGKTATPGPLVIQTPLTSIVVDDRANAQLAASGAILIDVRDAHLRPGGAGPRRQVSQDRSGSQ